LPDIRARSMDGKPGLIHDATQGNNVGGQIDPMPPDRLRNMVRRFEATRFYFASYEHRNAKLF
jgi:hypothetical protein